MRGLEAVLPTDRRPAFAASVTLARGVPGPLALPSDALPAPLCHHLLRHTPPKGPNTLTVFSYLGGEP